MVESGFRPHRSIPPHHADGVWSEDVYAFLRSVKDRNGDGQKIVASIKALSNLKVMVIGDTIIDEYAYCEPLGQSLKNPLVVHRYLGEERFAGGVIAVANQFARFCGEVHVVTVLGADDTYDDYIRSSLASNITAQIFKRDDAPTVVKRRYVYSDADHKVFEVCQIDDRDVASGLESEISTHISNTGGAYDFIAVCDYGHGTLTENIVSAARGTTKFLAVNAQTNSANLGYNLITKKYTGLDFACVDEAEARLALQDKYAPLETLGAELHGRLDARTLIVTCGRNGSVGFDHTGAVITAPALATRVTDRVGAGDAFYAVSAPCAAVGMPLDLVSLIGNATGALAVQIVGNRQPVMADDLFAFISSALG